METSSKVSRSGFPIQLDVERLGHIAEHAGLRGRLGVGREPLLEHFEQTLAVSPYLAGSELTCADIMVNFCLTSPRMFGGRDDLPNVRSYVERVGKRPAYVNAMQIAGPTAVLPDGT